MVIFLLGRIKLNMTLEVTATGALCRSGTDFPSSFPLHFRTLISKPFMYFCFVTQYSTISSKGFLTISTYIHFDRITLER